MKIFLYFTKFILLATLISGCQLNKPIITIVVPFDGYKEYLEEDVLNVYTKINNDVKFKVISVYGNSLSKGTWYSLPTDFEHYKNQADLYFGFSYNQYQEMLEKELLLNISDLVIKNEENYYQPILAAMTVDNKVYAMSQGFYNYVLAYNESLYESSNDLLDGNFFDSLGSKKPIEHIKYISLPGHNSFFYLYNFMSRPQEERLFTMQNGVLAYDKDSLKQLLIDIKDNYDKLSFSTDDFWHGNSMFAILSMNEIYVYKNSKEKLNFKNINYKTVKLPSLFNNDTKGYGVPGDLIGISSTSSKKYEASDFLSFFIKSYKKEIPDSGTSGHMPVYKPTEWEGYSEFKNFYDNREIPNLEIIRMDMKEYYTIAKYFDKLVKSYLENEVSLKGVLNNLDDKKTIIDFD